jgi:hypothetical protein
MILELETRALKFYRKNSLVKNHYALLRQEMASVVEATGSAHLQPLTKKNANLKTIENVEPHTLRKISSRLEEAEKLSSRGRTTHFLEEVRKTNMEISEEISTTLPEALILETVKSVCQKRSLTYDEIEQEQLGRIQKTNIMACLFCIIGPLCLLLSSTITLIPSLIVTESIAIAGLIATITGLVFMGENLLHRKLLSRMIQNQEKFVKLQMSISLVEKITDSNKKKAVLAELLNTILTVK